MLVESSSRFLMQTTSGFRTTLEDQLRRASENPSAGVFYGDAERFGDVAEAGRRFVELSPSAGEATFLNLATQRCTVVTSAMVRREVFTRGGILEESIRSSEDFDLWLRLAFAGIRFDYGTSEQVRWRRGERTVRRDRTRGGVNGAKIAQSAAVRPPPLGRCARSAPDAPTLRAQRRESVSWYRFASANAVYARVVFFMRPRYRTFVKPHSRFTTWKGCSTRARTRERAALIRSHFALRFPRLFTR